MAGRGGDRVLREAAVLREALLEQGRPVAEIAEAIAARLGVSLLKAQRLARGWTRPHTVERILATYDEDGLARPALKPHRLCGWEHGQQRPGEDYLDRLCRVYRTRADLLGYGHDYTPTTVPGAGVERVSRAASAALIAGGEAYSGASAASALVWGERGGWEPEWREAATDREQFLRASGAAGAAALLGGAAEASMRLSAKLGASNLGAATLDQLDLRVAGFVHDFDHVPSERLLGRVFDLHRSVEALLDGGQPLAQRRALHRIAGQLSFLLGALSFDLGDRAAAETHLLAAAQLAQETGDHRLLGWVRSMQSVSALWAADFEAAARWAQDGQRHSRMDGDMRARLAALCEARALARMGERGGTIAALEGAERAMPSQPHAGSDGWWLFGPEDLELYTAMALLWLGQPADAEPHARRAIAEFASAPSARQSPPSQAQAEMTLAGCLVCCGEPEEGLALATASLGTDLSAREANVQQARQFLATLSPQQRTLTTACDFADRLHTLSASRPSLALE